MRETTEAERQLVQAALNASERALVNVRPGFLTFVLERENDIRDSVMASLGSIPFTIRVVPESTFDLAVISGALQVAHRVELRGMADQYRNWGALAGAERLQQLALIVEPPVGAVDFQLPKLSTVECVGESAFGLLRSPRLAYVAADLARAPQGRWQIGPIEYFDIIVLKRAEFDFGWIEDPRVVKHLRVKGASRFDVAALADMENLEHLEIWSCREVVNVAALVNLPKLAIVEIKGADRVPDAVALRSLGPHVYLETGRCADLTLALADLGRRRIRWHISPMSTMNATKLAADAAVGIFTVERDEDEDVWEFESDDWSALGADDTDASNASAVAEDQLRSWLVPAFGPEFTSGELRFDSEHDALRIQATGEPLARRLATALVAYDPGATR